MLITDALPDLPLLVCFEKRGNVTVECAEEALAARDPHREYD